MERFSGSVPFASARTFGGIYFVEEWRKIMKKLKANVLFLLGGHRPSCGLKVDAALPGTRAPALEAWQNQGAHILNLFQHCGTAKELQRNLLLRVSLHSTPHQGARVKGSCSSSASGAAHTAVNMACISSGKPLTILQMRASSALGFGHSLASEV